MMPSSDKNHILLIKADLIDGVENEGAKAAWINTVGRDELFEEVRDEGGNLTHYGLRAENLAAIIANESTPRARKELRDVLYETQEVARGAMVRHEAKTGADGVTRIEGDLPFVFDPRGFREQFHRMAARAAKLAEGINGAGQASMELGQALKKIAEGWDEEEAELWKGALESDEYAKNWEGTTVLTYCPETGMISAIPHKGEGGSPLGAHDTHVVAQDGGRRPLAIFAGLPGGEPFRKTIAEAYLETYLDGDALTESEAKAFEKGLGWTGGASGEGRAIARKDAQELLDGVRAGDRSSVDKAWSIFRKHAQEKTGSSLQVGTAISGGVHLGVLPAATLGKIFKKLESWNLAGDGVLAISPDGEEGEKIVARYGRMWTPERRDARMKILTQSDMNFKEGSVGFIRVMRGEFLGAAQSGEDPGDRRIAAMMGPAGARFDDKVLVSLDRMLLEVEDKYGSKGDHGAASLPELCDRFLSAEKPNTRSPWKKSYNILKQTYEQYRASRKGAGVTRGVAAEEKLYDAVASFMVDRFGVGGGEEGARLRGAVRALVAAAAKTGYLYLMADPSGNAVKVGITNNLPERLGDVARENGPMCLAACYAFKSIPVSSWSTELVTEAVDGKSSDTFVALTGLTGEAARVSRNSAKMRLSRLRAAFGFESNGDDGEPSDFTAFCVKGMLSLCGEDGRREGGVSPSDMLDILRGTAGVEPALCEPLSELWGQYLKGGAAGTDPVYQRETLKVLNKVILSMVAGERLSGELLAAAEDSHHGLLGVDAKDRDLVYKYGGQIGPAVAEKGAHRLLGYARRDSGEFFYLGGNFDQIIESIAGVAGGSEVHRYLLAESQQKEWGGSGELARQMRNEINTAPKPDITLSWSGGEGGAQSRIRGLWKSAKNIRERERNAEVETDRAARKTSENDGLPVYLQLAMVLAGKTNTVAGKDTGKQKAQVKDAAEEVRQLLGMDAEEFEPRLMSQGDPKDRDGAAAWAASLNSLWGGHKGAEISGKIINAARATIAETEKGSAADIPPIELVEFLANPERSRTREARDAVRGAVMGIDFPCEDRPKFSRALRMALGGGLGEYGLGGYPVSGGPEEKACWRKSLEEAPGPFLAAVGGYSRERALVPIAEIMQAADALDLEFTQGSAESKVVLVTYGAVACGCMPPDLKAAIEKKPRGLSKKLSPPRKAMEGVAAYSR